MDDRAPLHHRTGWQEHPAIVAETGRCIRDTILTSGMSRSAIHGFLAFRGPSVRDRCSPAPLRDTADLDGRRRRIVIDLQELEAIKRLKYRYMRCVDQKRWDELEEVFVEEATCSYSGGKYAFEGRKAIIGFLSRSMGRDTFFSSHRVHQPEIDLTGPDTARGTWALEDTVIDHEHDIVLLGAAFYTDEYVKMGGHWKIRHTGYERTFEEVYPRKNLLGLRLTEPSPRRA